MNTLCEVLLFLPEEKTRCKSQQQPSARTLTASRSRMKRLNQHQHLLDWKRLSAENGFGLVGGTVVAIGLAVDIAGGSGAVNIGAAG